MAEVQQQTEKMKGIRIRALNVLMMCLVVLVAASYLYTVYQTDMEYRELEDAANRHIASAAASNNMKEASNYLTIQVRTFAATQNPVYLNNYFTEAVVTQRREKAIQTIQDNLLPGDDEAETYLDEALEHSRTLMQREYYSMKLVVEAKGIEYDEKCAALDDVELTPEDAALSPAQKIELATSMVYDEEYADEVDVIESSVTSCKRSLLEAFEGIKDQNSTELHRLIVRQEVLTVVMLIVVLALVLSFALLLLRPVKRYIERIEGNKPLPMSGAYELRFLARAYNEMYDENLRSRNQLQRKAEHDHLTGLYNREVFERLLHAYRTEPIALLLVDADYFKTVNDTLGHDGGDAMLKKLADQLTHTFRSTDAPCRIGGDEFAVIMTDMRPDLEYVVKRKVEALRAGMRDTSDGLPEMTLSIGIAFSGGGAEADTLFKQADTALYQVKEAGRNGYAFYKE